MLRTLSALAALCCAVALQPALVRTPDAHACLRPRAAAVVMKGRGSRGLPGKFISKPTTDTGVKKRMQKRDFDRKEWVAVCKLDDIPEMGATKAVEAGKQPGKMGPTGFVEGGSYIWCLVRGEPRPPREGEEGEEPDAGIFATDGSCRACQFPMTAGSWESGNKFTCSCCGTSYDLESGEVVEYMPKNNPVQWAAAMANQDKEPQRAAVLPTRVSRSGRVYVRLPDNTII